VVFSHFLFPAGGAGALAARAASAPHVVMAHGQDVANLGRVPGITAATRWVVGGSAAVIANSNWLADRLIERIPSSEAKIEIADCGVDLDAFAPQPAADARRELGWEGEGPAFLCVGSLIERKNVVRLADAFELLGRGRLALSAMGRCATSSRAGPESGSSAGSRRRTSPGGLQPATSSASPRFGSPSARRLSRGWPWNGP